MREIKHKEIKKGLKEKENDHTSNPEIQYNLTLEKPSCTLVSGGQRI